MTILSYEEAKAQAELALANLAASGYQPGQDSGEPVSMDRECPRCGLVQPDDDSTDCWCCGAVLNPDDIDPTLCECGNPGFAFFSGRWHCWDCVQQLAEDEAEKDEVRDLGSKL
jgi:hypothetical protein